MSEYCDNKLTVIGDDDDEHARFWRDAKGADTTLSFNSLIPMPDDLDDAVSAKWVETNWGTVMYEEAYFFYGNLNPYISEWEFRTA